MIVSDINFLFIGWCRQEKKGVKSDKVWTAFEVNGNYYSGWGLVTKPSDSSNTHIETALKKFCVQSETATTKLTNSNCLLYFLTSKTMSRND